MPFENVGPSKKIKALNVFPGNYTNKLAASKYILTY